MIHGADLTCRPNATPYPAMLLSDHLQIFLGSISYKLKTEVHIDGLFSVKKINDLVQMINTGINNIIHHGRCFFPYSGAPSEVIFGVTAWKGENLFH